VDGTLVTTGDPLAEGPELAVVVTIPGFVAHSLAHTLADWSHCVEVMTGGRHEDDLTAILHAAARQTGIREALACEDQLALPSYAVVIT